MTTLCLSAGTDVAEMALFDVDALPRRLPRDVEDFAPLTSHGQMVQFPVGADGGYLLHLFVDEPVPASTMRYCFADDKLSGDFHTAKGRIAFGGLESAYAEFKPNPSIRADGSIEPGRYGYTAYRTDFPDELITQAIRVERTTGERWLMRAPALATYSLLTASLALAITGQFGVAGLAFLSSILACYWLQRLPGYRTLAARRKQAQLTFPSIVVELRFKYCPGRSGDQNQVER